MKKLILLFPLSLALSIGLAQNISDEAWRFSDCLIQEMTLSEKVGQMTLFTSDLAVTGPTLREGYRQDVIAGKVGALFNAHTSDYTHELQRLAVEETRLGIPLLFGFDVVHGYRTIFPIPLGESASWNLEAIEQSARIAAIESSAAGLHWTFAPMVDIARDPRWGRMSEGAGEDTYLGSLIAAARVKGFQGEDISSSNTLLSCVKHFAAYGAAQAGRDYHTTDLSDRTLRETYLPPFKASLDAGAYSIMTAFNDLNGIPATGNSYLLRDILRDEWGFEGMVVTDYTSINEMVNHGIVASNEQAGKLAVEAGVDMDMQSAAYYDYLVDQVNNGEVEESNLDESVRYILALKYMLGLFDDPYRYGSQEREEAEIFAPEHLAAALDISTQSLVLLKNEEVLPLSSGKRLAIVGPMADNQRDQLGNWIGDGKAGEVITPLSAFKATDYDLYYAKGCEVTGEADEESIAEAVVAASQSDVVLAFVGEAEWMSGEAASRSQITLPGPQRDLITALKETGKPLVLILMNGRPLDLSWENKEADAILEAWYPGTMGGPAIVDVLTGDANPSGRLPVTFPRSIGQVPIHYNMKNTGRPYSEGRYTSKYLDVENSPLFPFGYGLSYSTISYGIPRPSATEFSDSITIKCKIRNEGPMVQRETVQLYIRDMVGSVTRPVQELKAFQQIMIKPGELLDVEFTLTKDDLAFYTRDMSWEAEPGAFQIQIGPHSGDVKTVEVTLLEN